MQKMQKIQVRALGQEDPLEEEIQPFLPEKSPGQKTSHRPWGSKEWGTTEQQRAYAHTHTSVFMSWFQVIAHGGYQTTNLIYLYIR